MTPLTYDYCVPVTVHGQAPGQGASATLYVLAYSEPSDVAAAQTVRTTLSEMGQLTLPNLNAGDFEIGQPMPVTVTPVEAS